MPKPRVHFANYGTGRIEAFDRPADQADARLLGTMRKLPPSSALKGWVVEVGTERKNLPDKREAQWWLGKLTLPLLTNAGATS